jgi:hypothetical protein
MAYREKESVQDLLGLDIRSLQGERLNRQLKQLKITLNLFQLPIQTLALQGANIES